MFQLSPLGPADLAEAQALAASLFPWESEHQEALPASVDPACGAAFLSQRGLSRVRTWSALDADRVVGLSSLYEYAACPDEVWLAWFGLAPVARGRGWGSQMLDSTIARCRSERRSVLRLWTTIEDEYAAALALYARRGFRPELQPPLPGENWQTVVLSLSLSGGVPQPWRTRANGTPLCGRVSKIAA